MATDITFADYLGNLADPKQRTQLQVLFDEIEKAFPQLEQRVAWNQPMYTDHGTFIIGFSAAKAHMSVAIEDVAQAHFLENIDEVGLTRTSKLFRIPWSTDLTAGPVKDLLFEMIQFNIADKKNVTTFWRK